MLVPGPAPLEHEIHRVLALVAPVANVPRLQARVQLVQHEVLPQQAFVFRPQLAPTAEHAHEPGVEAEHAKRQRAELSDGSGAEDAGALAGAAQSSR